MELSKDFKLKLLKSLGINLFSLSLLLIMLNFFTSVKVNSFISMETTTIVLFIGFSIWAVLIEKTLIKKISSFIFFILLSIISVNPLLHIDFLPYQYLTIATISFGVVFFWNQRSLESEKDDYKNKKPGWEEILFIIIILVIGFIIRVVSLSSNSLAIDELYSGEVARNIAENGIFFKMPGGIEYFNSPISILFTSFFIKIFGFNEFSMRLFGVIIGTAILALFYFFSKRFTNRGIAIISTIYLTFNWYILGMSRTSRGYNLLIFLVLFLFLLSDSKWFLENIKKASLIFGITLITIFSIRTPYLITLLPCLGLIYFNIQDESKVRKRKMLNYILYVIFILTLVTTTVFILDPNIKDFFLGFIIQNLILEFSFSTEQFLFFYSMMPLFVVLIPMFIVSLIKKVNKKNNVIIGFFFLIILLTSTVFKSRNIDPRYTYFLFILIIPFWIKSIKELFNSLINNKRYTYIAITLGLVILLMLHPFTLVYASNFNGLTPNSKINWEEGCNYIKENLKEGDVIMGNMPFNTKFYCGKIDYWIRQREIEWFSYPIYDKNNNIVNWVEGYSGSQNINYLQLKKLLDEKRVWIIGDHNLLTLDHTDKEVLLLLRIELTKIKFKNNEIVLFTNAVN